MLRQSALLKTFISQIIELKSSLLRRTSENIFQFICHLCDSCDELKDLYFYFSFSPRYNKWACVFPWKSMRVCFTLKLMTWMSSFACCGCDLSLMSQSSYVNLSSLLNLHSYFKSYRWFSVRNRICSVDVKELKSFSCYCWQINSIWNEKFVRNLRMKLFYETFEPSAHQKEIFLHKNIWNFFYLCVKGNFPWGSYQGMLPPYEWKHLLLPKKKKKTENKIKVLYVSEAIKN